jgi:anti-sigma B factor antagonist
VCSQIRVLMPRSDASSVVLDASSDGSDATVTVKIGGEVDLYSVAELKRRLESVLTEASGRTIVIDLEALEFLGACGVTALLTAQRCAEDAGREVQVINAQGSPARGLRLLGLESWCKQAAGGDVKASDEPH